MSDLSPSPAGPSTGPSTGPSGASTGLTAVPAGSSVLHVGPHKTGTTALQEALRRARADLLAQGVRLAGPGDGEGDGVRYAIGMRSNRGQEAGKRIWEQITADMADASVPRRIFSRETFANASAKRARIVLEELGHGTHPIHVVITARPLAELIPSQYSQFVQRGTCLVPFDEWYTRVLAAERDERSIAMFWKRHSHDEQVVRWGGLVGFENVTLMVVDRADPEFLPRSFEQLLDVRPGTLTERMGHARGNRSLTLAELELVRQWHEITAPTGTDHGELVRLAWRLCHHLRRFDPDPVDPRPTLPPWAIARANELAAASAAAIAASGVRVAGDLGALSAVPVPGRHDEASAPAQRD